MAKALFSVLLVSLSLSRVFSGTVVIEGNYQKKNLYIQNSYGSDGVGFCAYEVLVNGIVTTDEVSSKTFEIDFSSLPIAPGTHVVVEIKYKNDCAPKVLNPEVLQPQPDFEMVSIKIDGKGLLSWTTKNEKETLPFIIEQFRWNKWVKVGEVSSKGKVEKNSYSFQAVPHSGENKFRVKQTGFGVEKKSENVTFKSTIKSPEEKIDLEKSIIQFSENTLFEVYDIWGNVVKYGYGNSLNIANLSKGSYFVCYDNIVTDFIKE